MIRKMTSTATHHSPSREYLVGSPVLRSVDHGQVAPREGCREGEGRLQLGREAQLSNLLCGGRCPLPCPREPFPQAYSEPPCEKKVHLKLHIYLHMKVVLF